MVIYRVATANPIRSRHWKPFNSPLTGVIEDVSQCLTMDAKVPGDLVYVVGITTKRVGRVGVL
jgi:hypothetical protein